MRSEALAGLMEEHVPLKKSWGGLTETWTPHYIRDQVIDFIHESGGERSGLSELQIVGWVGMTRSNFYDWQTRHGKANERKRYTRHLLTGCAQGSFGF
jgi:hypothetical protein